MHKKISNKTFMEQIDRLGIDYTDETKKRLMFVLDEDFNEVITYGEFIDVCDAYGAELPQNMPKNYVSVEKRALIKLVRKMKKKQIKGEHIFMMQDSDVVSASDFMNFVNKTLRLSLKKREQHALVNLCDTNKNNTIAKDEFLEFVKKGERLLESYPQPVVNNFFEPAETIAEERTSNSKKPKLTREETATYSGDAKVHMIHIIAASEHLSIEDFFNRE